MKFKNFILQALKVMESHGHGKLCKIEVFFVRLVTANVKTRKK